MTEAEAPLTFLGHAPSSTASRGSDHPMVKPGSTWELLKGGQLTADWSTDVLAEWGAIAPSSPSLAIF